GDNASKYCSRNNMNFIQNDETPFTRCDEIHHFLCIVCSLPSICNHGICRHNDSGLTFEALLAICGKYCDTLRFDVRPLEELLAPLHNGHTTRTEHHNAFLDSTRSCDANKRLTSTTRQNNNPRPRTPIPEHLREGFLLIRANLSGRLQIDLQVGIGC